MGFYGERVLPRLLNVACATKSVEPLRRRVCEGLSGEVVEIGFGSGLNVPFYPAAVTGVAAVEPADVSWQLAEKRLRASRVPVQRSGLDGQALPFADDSYDAARAATRPQARWNPALHRARAGPGRRGAQLATTRRAGAEAGLRRVPPHEAGRRPADKAGFTITELDVFYEKGAPKIMAAHSLGNALSA